MEETSAPWVYDRVTKWWVDLSQGVAGLEPGLADGRYVCRACKENLVLRSAKPGAANRPHFSHKANPVCSAAPEVREPLELELELELDDRIVIEFQQRIIRVWPGAHCVLEFPNGLDGGGEGPAGVLPRQSCCAGAAPGTT
ncbi:competence protein CoiA family protein [Kitasatospora sp. NPDC101447]|uniref:competence protein CoiA family protein n=1 Tax=Kitasatospora sp. NPDC101447 TaxID=3364102 RepID=UPI00380ECB59